MKGNKEERWQRHDLLFDEFIQEMMQFKAEYAGGQDPETARRCWGHQLSLILKFLKSLDPETTTEALIPLTDLMAALEDLAVGTKHPALKRVWLTDQNTGKKIANRPQKSQPYMAQMSMASAAIDALKDAGETVESATNLVAKVLKSAQLVGEDFEVKTLKNFRLRYKDDPRWGKVRNDHRTMFNEFEPSLRKVVVLSVIKTLGNKEPT